MVVLAELDKAPDPASANLIEAQSGNTHELAASGYDRSFAVIVGHGFVPSYVAARVYFGTASITPGPDPRSPLLKNEHQLAHDAAHRAGHMIA
jgi:hypothetical protein